MPLLDGVLQSLVELIEISDVPMLGRTHGQPANITTLSKEISVFLERLVIQLTKLKHHKLNGKISGSTGSYSELYFSKEVNWIELNSRFIESLGLVPEIVTTQILPYDNLIELFNIVQRTNNIALDFAVNIWLYIHLGYFTQKVKLEEVGSSIMPHKVNPIYFEGAEGGFELSNSLLTLYTNKLSKSRYQRDLSDSTVKRSFGIAFGYSTLSWQSLEEALTRISPNYKKIQQDLDEHWEIFSSNLQTRYKLLGLDNTYEDLKSLTRGHELDKKQFNKLKRNMEKDMNIEKKEIDIQNITSMCRKAVEYAKKNYYSYLKIE